MAKTLEELQALKEATEELARANERLKESSSPDDFEKLKTAQENLTRAREAAAKAQQKDTAAYKEAIKVSDEAQRIRTAAQKSINKTAESSTSLADKVKDLGIDFQTVAGAAGLLGVAATAGVTDGAKAFDKFAKPLRDIEINAIRTFGSLDTESSRLFVEKQKELRRFVADQATGQAAVDARLKTLALDPLKAQQEIVEEQNKIQATVGQNLDRFKSEIADPDVILNLRGLRSALGLSAEETAIFANRAAAFGTSIESQLAVATKAGQKFAKSSGVDFKVIAKGQNDLRKNTKAFATFSEEQLARVAAASAKTGVALSTMGGGLVDSFDDFDQAAEKAAMLGQAFGISIDSFELFATEDPTERLQMIQEAASRAGVDIANMGRRELNYLSELTGMGVEDTMKALGQGGLEVAAEVAGMDKAGDLQAQIVSSNRMNTDAVTDLTRAIGSLIPPISETGDELKKGGLARLARGVAGVSGELQDQVANLARRGLTGGTENLRGTPGATGVLGAVAGIQQDPNVRAFVEQQAATLAQGGEATLNNITKQTDALLKKVADPSVRAAMAKDLIDTITKTAAAKAAAAKSKAVAAGKSFRDKAVQAGRRLAGGDQGDMDEEISAVGATNAAMRGGRAAATATEAINLIVNVSLPVDGDAIASAAYTGQIRPGVTGEQALQAAAANENPAGQ
jgi:hypothetical protein